MRLFISLGYCQRAQWLECYTWMGSLWRKRIRTFWFSLTQIAPSTAMCCLLLSVLKKRSEEFAASCDNLYWTCSKRYKHILSRNLFAYSRLVVVKKRTINRARLSSHSDVGLLWDGPRLWPGSWAGWGRSTWCEGRKRNGDWLGQVRIERVEGGVSGRQRFR